MEQHNYIDRILRFLTGLGVKKPKALIAVVLVLVALSVAGISVSKFGSDVTRLIPSDAEKTALYFDLMNEFGSMEKLYIVFRSDNIREELDRIDEIGNELKSSEHFTDVRWKITPEMRDFAREVIAKKLPLYLSQEELDEFLKKLSPKGIHAQLLKTKARLGLPGAGMLIQDPLNLFEPLQGRMKFSDVAFDIQSGYFLAPDGKTLIMTATPKVSARDISGSGRMLNYTDSVIKKHLSPELSASVTGSHAITHYEASIMKREIALNILGSLIGVTLIFLIAFKGLRGFAASVIPVLMSIVLALGIVGFIARFVTEVSGAFGALLIGLGVDLGIVLYVRYIVYSQSGIDRDVTIKKSIQSAGSSITFGVLTTAATFLPMATSSFRGIREIGILTSLGILLTWVLVFGLFPILAGRASAKGRLGFTFIKKLFSFSYNHSVLVISLSIFLTVVLALFAGGIKVEGDILKLGAKENPARDLMEMLTAEYLRLHTVFLTGTANTPEEASEKSAHIRQALSNDLESALSISDLLPPPSEQAMKIKTLEGVSKEIFEKNFKKEAENLGFNPEIFKDYIGVVGRMLESKNQVTMQDLSPVKNALDRFLSKNPDGTYRFIVMASLKSDTALNDAYLQRAGISYTGPEFVKKELLHLLWKDGLTLTVIGLVLVNIILYLDFRNPYHIFLAQIPVLMSIIIVLGFMGATGITLNFMDAIVFVMLFGIGTDYSIHILHRYRDGGDMNALAEETGSAVLLAGLTTVAGFGSLAFSSYRGLSYMGIVSGLGVLSCVILSLTLIPAFIGIYEKTSHRK